MIFTSSCCDNLSIDEIIERAEKGDCEAQYIVGFYYNRDSAIDSPDDEKAFYWLKLAAEQGHCEAQYSLGQKYTEDKSRHKDNEQAIFWLKKAALQGHTFASNALGWTLDRGEAPNYKEAHSRVIGTPSFKLHGIITLAKGWTRTISKRCTGI